MADRPSWDGVFANGVTAAAVVGFILDYDQTARVDDVAAWFGIEVDDVFAALGYYAERLQDTRALVRGRDGRAGLERQAARANRD